MVSPGPPFAGQRYVSDVLESLLDARAAREGVRAYVRSLVASTQPSLRAALEPIAAYIGGKCMGYPAIWFLQEVLDEHDASAVIARCRGTLCVSLSTSIVDDVADRDETYDSAYLAFLYLLIGEATFTAPRGNGAQERLHEALAACLDPHETSSDMSRRGDRIGAFFAMIAGDAVSGAIAEPRATLVVAAAREFGRLCAHIDDAMDVQRDLSHGVTQNAVLLLLREELGRTVTRDDLQMRSEVDALVGTLLLSTAQETIALLRAAGAQRAMEAMQRLSSRLEDWPENL